MSIYITRQMVHPASEKHCASESKGLFRLLLDAWIRNWRRRKMIATLEALDDRVLRDIGLYRGDIQRVVNGFDDRELGMVPFRPTATSAGTEREAHLKAA